MWPGAQLWGQTCKGLKLSLFTARLVSPPLSSVIQKMGYCLHYGPECLSPPSVGALCQPMDVVSPLSDSWLAHDMCCPLGCSQM